MEYVDVKRINERIKDDPEALIAQCEEYYYNKIKITADGIMRVSAEKPLVFVCGPSGSGKTTTAQKIAHILDTSGHETHAVSMDNYFLPYNAGNIPVDEKGQPDLETPLRLDIPLFRKQMTAICRCEKVNIPTFDFKTQTRGESYPLHKKPGEIVIVEGIHALNPLVTGDIDDKATSLFVNVRSRIRLTDGSYLSRAQIRLLRRFCRDKLFRGKNLGETLGQYNSVNSGERKYISPFKANARVDIDTNTVYEFCVYKNILYDKVKLLAESGSDVCAQIIKCFDECESIPTNLVPKTSLIREFIGGGSIF